MLAPNPDLQPTIQSVFGLRTTIDLDGTVEGYASRFGEIDQARDMVMPGAFKATLATRGVRRIPMLFQHDPAEPVGVWLELREDANGLYARGRLIPEVARGRELLSLIRQGAIDGLSIGFKTVRGRVDPRTRIRRLYAVDLWEISIVTFPLLAGARGAGVGRDRRRRRAGGGGEAGETAKAVKDIQQAYARGRWMCPNAGRFIRPDAARWLLPNRRLWRSHAKHEQKYSPDQPRVPAGNSDGGQWTTVSSGGGISIALPTSDVPSGDGSEGFSFGDDTFASITEALDNIERELSRIRLAGDIPTGDSPPEIPNERPSTTRERNRIARKIARWRGPYIWLAIESGHWLYEHRAEINSFFDEPKSLAELQAGAADPLAGYDVHHIVEQAAAARDGFSDDLINSAENLVAVPRWKHWLINAWYQTPNEEFSWLSPRNYLIGKPWSVRKAVGLKALRLVGVLKR